MDALATRRHLGKALPRAARQPRHGRRRLPRDQRHRHGALGYPRQGAQACRCTSCSEEPEGNTRVCRWRFARLPAAGRAHRRGTQERRSGGYKAIKLRLGDTPKNDVERIRPRRKAFGDDLVILTDANIGYQLEDVRRVMPVLDEIGAGWLEEPFPAHDYRSYREAKLLRPHAARRRREPLHALRVQPRDRGRRHHHPAAGPVEDAAASPRRCASPPSARAGSCRSTRTAR